MRVEQRGESRDVALRRGVEQLAVHRQRIDVRLERAPAREAVLLGEVELRIGELRVGFSSRSSSSRRFACLRSQSRFGVSGSDSGPDADPRVSSDMMHLHSFERREPFHAARCPQLGRGIEGYVSNDRGWVEPFTRTVGRPRGTDRTLWRARPRDKVCSRTLPRVTREISTETIWRTRRPHRALSWDLTPPRDLSWYRKQNPRYFAVAGNEAKAIYLTGSHIWNNFHDGLGPGKDVRRGAGAQRLRCVSRVPQEARSQLHPTLALGAVQVAGGGRQLPSVHDAAAVAAHRSRNGEGWQAEVRSVDVRPGVLRPTPRARDRGRQPGIYVAVMFFDGWALHLSPAPDNVEGHPFHAANNVNGIGITSIVDYQVLPLDPRVAGAPGGVHPQGRRYGPRPAERSLRGRQRVIRRRNGRPAVRPDAGYERACRTGATRPSGSTG